MIDRIILKIRVLVHFMLHFFIYKKAKVILRGVPRILYGHRIKFGNLIRLNDNVFIHAVNGVEIGDNTTLSYGVVLLTESYDISSKNKYLLRKHKGAPIKIGKNVWICANSTILPGVSIADNIIVGAGSVVTKDLDRANSLYAGNPARFIKELDF
ncbi:acyltransferase [Gallibacterium anatis]|uniref:acyltransferase n=1 Tax=Gallibacterium anatis TaxID=750 RepID=UPI00254AAB1A|nr:acyltransferase [Gallibacterium anatis]WIM85537.1 acyltransferase [Gallibacterium anatis]